MIIFTSKRFASF